MKGRTSIFALDQQECWDLLATSNVGRLGYATEHAMPVIRPVPFVVRGESVVVALGQPPLPPETWKWPTVATFETDEWHPEQLRGWAVHVVGRVVIVDDPAEVAAVAKLGLTA